MSRNKLVELTITEGVGVITINNPPVNALTTDVRDQLKALLNEVNGKS